MRNVFSQHHQEGEKRSLNSELWHACAGPLVSLPTLGSHVVYFPQGHSEQVAASTNKEIDGHIPNYPNLPPQLTCQLHHVTLQADIETDEVYAQMTLQPLTTQEQKDSYLAPDLGTQSRQPTNYFCKTLTASDTSTHGGFSIPRRAAEKVFPPLDFTQQPPVQELIARDLHDTEWKFRHIYRGQPKRHLLTTGWSVFVSAKRLVAGDSVLFIRNEKGQLLLGIRRANRTHTVMPSSVLSSDSMHIGVLAAAAHAASTNCRFTIFYNPRASPSEFVIPLSKYEKAVYHTRFSIGMRFRMLFETEESTVRRYMGTITGLGDLDPVRWPNSQWRSLKVGWDESTAGERQPRVSLWEIEPLTTFLMYPPPYPLGLKRPWSQLQGMPSIYGNDDCSYRRSFMSERGDTGETLNFQTIGMDPWMQMQQRFESSLSGIQSGIYSGLPGALLQETASLDQSKQMKFQSQQAVQSEQLQSRPQMQLQRNIIEQHQQQHLLQQQVQVLNLEQQTPNHLLQQQFQRQPLQQQLVQQNMQNSINEPQQSSHQHQQNQQHTFQVTNVSSLPQIPSSQSQSSMSDICSVSSRPVFTNTSTSIVSSKSSCNASPFQSVLDSLATEGASPYLSLPRSTQPIGQQPADNLTWSCIPPDQVSASWFSPKKISNSRTHCLPSNQVEAPLPPGSHHVLTQTQTEPGFQVNIPAPSMSMPQFPLRDSPAEQEGVHSDSQSNLLFGVNIENPTLAMSDAGSRNIGNGSYVASSFSVTDLLNVPSCGPVSGYPMNSNTSACGGIDESGFSQCASNATKMNPPTRTFTKVYKLGSVGRSVDVTRFRGYPELRAELDHMFGLEGQLEEPQRSGWQLVFVDKEKDVLLLGDDPWEEFVNNVRLIKILSPPEVQQMSQEGMELLSSIPTQQPTSSSSEDCVARKVSRNIGSVITSTGPLDY